MLLLARLLTVRPQMEPQRRWSPALQALQVRQVNQVSQGRRETKVITSLEERQEIRSLRTAGRAMPP